MPDQHTSSPLSLARRSLFADVSIAMTCISAGIISTILIIAMSRAEVIQMLGEFGFLEISQALMLIGLIAIGVFIVLASKQQQPNSTYSIIDKVFGVGALLAFSFLLREVDVEQLAIHQGLILIGSGLGRNILLAVLWLITLTYFLKDRPSYTSQLLYVLKHPLSTYFFIGGASLMAGALFDKKIIETSSSELWEETAEFIGFLCILMGGVAYLITHRSRKSI